MFIKRLLNLILNQQKSLNSKIFVLVIFSAFFALPIMLVFGLVLGESTQDLLAILAALIIFAITMVLAVKYDKIQLGANIICFIGIFALLPLQFFTGGGVASGAPLWFLIFELIALMTISGKIKWFYIISCVLVSITCYILAYKGIFPVIEYERDRMYQDSLISLLLMEGLIILMIGFVMAVYNSENKKLQKQKKEIEMLNRSQNRFFASMSHEIRTPINTIIGLNEITLREDISDEVAENSLNIQSASKMLLNLVNDILDMSKIESGQIEITPTTYNAGDMLSDIVGMLWIRAKEKNLEFHIDVDPALPALLIGDEIRIKQILINVLMNAIKYTLEGSVTLSIGYTPAEKQGEKARITYTVSDTGIGIKKESLPHIFSAFRRVEEKENRYIEGTGLGLAIVKQFIDLMGGTIKVNSIYTQGTTFIIEIPQEVAGNQEIGELHLETRHSMNYHRQSTETFEAPDAKILVVDDNTANLLVVKKLLRNTKVQIDTALSGKDALAKTLSTAYNLIFMDHLMSEMDGIQCLHAIREQIGGLCKEVPVVVLTANAGSENQALYTKEGFNGYLLKPVSGQQLEEMLLAKLPRDLLHIEESGVQEVHNELDDYYNKRLPLVITTESICDLPADYLKANDIAVIPYYVHTGAGDFYDGIETDSRSLISYLHDENGKALSEAPTVEEYEQFFAKQLTRANNIIHITMTSKSGLGYERAKQAAETFGNVTIIDSKHLSSGTGLFVMEASRLCREGYSLGKICSELENFAERIHTSFIVDDTRYLTRAGRLSPAVNRIAQSLYLHPVLNLKKGKLIPQGVCVGDRKQVWKRYIRKTLRYLHLIDDSVVFITHAGLTTAELFEIERTILRRFRFKKVITQKASSAITANCGLGTFGVIFKTKE